MNYKYYNSLILVTLCYPPKKGVLLDAAPDFFAIRLSKEDGIQELLDFYNKKNFRNDFYIEGLTHHKNDMKIDDFVFLVGIGDKKAISFNYTQGLYGVARLSSAPIATTGREFGIKVRFIFFFERVLTKDDFLPFPDTVNIPYIGPSTKGSKNQATSTIATEQAKAIITSAQKITKTNLKTYSSIFPWFYNSIFGISEKSFNKMTDNHSPALGITKIAFVFSEFIKNYSHEDSATMIGIFGKWGRGKTFFFKEIKKSFSSKKPDEKYFFTVFQPWRYQEKESAWAYLYQTVLQTFLNNETGWWCKKCCNHTAMNMNSVRKML